MIIKGQNFVLFHVYWIWFLSVIYSSRCRLCGGMMLTVCQRCVLKYFKCSCCCCYIKIVVVVAYQHNRLKNSPMNFSFECFHNTSGISGNSYCYLTDERFLLIATRILWPSSFAFKTKLKLERRKTNIYAQRW